MNKDLDCVFLQMRVWELEAERDRLKLDSDRLQFVLRVLRVFDSFDGPDSDCLWWRTDGEYAPVTLFVKFGDVFCGGSFGMEKITEENIGVLEQCDSDLGAIGRRRRMHADLLFCARVRQMRPQGLAYLDIEADCWPLFDACGPEREVGVGNPYTREQAIAQRNQEVAEAFARAQARVVASTTDQTSS